MTKNKIVTNICNCSVKIYIGMGILCLTVYFLPYFILRENASYIIHDLLEVDVPYFLLNSRYFFTPVDFVVPDIMNGMGRQAIQVSSWLTVVLFGLFQPITAYLVNYFFISVAAFAGMFLLLDFLLSGRYRPILFASAGLFSVLPIYPNHGLTFVGIPLVIYALLLISLDKHKPFAYLVIILYALSSSLTYAGYIVIGMMLLFSIYLYFKRNFKAVKGVLCGVGILVACSLFTHASTIYSLLMSEAYTSHRVEFSRDPKSLLSIAKEIFINGQYHSPSLHKMIAFFSGLILLLSLLVWKKTSRADRKLVYGLLSIQFLSVAIALFAGLYLSSFGLNIRKHLGVLSSFQLDRIYTVYPVLWYIALALSLVLLVKFLPLLLGETLLCKILSIGIACTMISAQGYYVISRNRPYQASLARLAGKETGAFTWDGFFSPDLMEQVKAYIGRSPQTYRVVSLGISPGVALYNGFYCLDAYSVNYSLDYKKSFRKTIAQELEKDPALKDSFDRWGSRCYLLAQELGLDFFYTKNRNKTVTNLAIDTSQLSEMGCSYIISAVTIENAAELGLRLLETFESPQSPWRIFLYAL